MANLIKAMHVICGVFMLSMMVSNLIALLANFSLRHSQGLSHTWMRWTIRWGIGLGGWALLTGIILVPLKQYHYLTPWIAVAYTVLLGILLSLVYFGQHWVTQPPTAQNMINASTYNRQGRRIVFLHSIIVGCLMVIVHDAVVKHTLFG